MNYIDIQRLQKCTGLENSKAKWLLQQCDWNLQRALNVADYSQQMKFGNVEEAFEWLREHR